MEERMRKAKRSGRWLPALTGVLSLVLVAVLVFCLEGFVLVGRADSQGTVKSTARIRKEASTSSEQVGSVAAGKTITIKGSTTGSDGNTWYQVDVDSTTTGYIRSDLVDVAGGTTPAATDPGNSDTGTYNPTVAVTDVQAVNAVVSDANGARMRGDASANSGIVKQVAGNSTVTVTGQATGDDGYTWYRVVYNDGSAEYTGFIRDGYLQIDEEVLPIDNGGDANVDNGEGSNDSGIDISKDYDTQKDGDDWYLIDNNANGRYKIKDILETAQTNYQIAVEKEKTVKTQTVVIVILVILLIVAILAATLLFFKVRDVMDEAYFAAAEKETRERNAARSRDPRAPGRNSAGGASGRNNGARPAGTNGLPTVGAGRPANPQNRQQADRNPGVRQTAGRAEAGQGRPMQGRSSAAPTQRPVGPRSEGSQGRPAQGRAEANAGMRNPSFQAGQRPQVQQGSRNVAGRPGMNPERQGGSAMQNRQSMQSEEGRQGMQTRPTQQARPQGEERPMAGAGVSRTNARVQGNMSGNAAQGSPAQGAPAGNRPAGRNASQTSSENWKARNFMDEDEDDMDFEYLDWNENGEDQ